MKTCFRTKGAVHVRVSNVYALRPFPFTVSSFLLLTNKRNTKWQAKEETRWFNPTTAQRTDALLRRRMPERLEETVEERVKRMAAVDDHRRRCDRNGNNSQALCMLRIVFGGHRFESGIHRWRHGPKARQAGDRNCAREKSRVCR